MQIQRWLAVLLLISSSMASHASWAKQLEQAPVESVVAMQVDGWLSFDTAGGVEDYRITTQLPESIRAALDGTVRKWKFHPVMVDGVPRHAKTRMRVTLAAKQESDGIHVKVDNVVFPSEQGDVTAKVDGQPEPISGKKLRPPGYPVGLMQQGVSGAVLLAIRVGPDGRAADVLAVQSMLYDVRGGASALRVGIRMLEQSAVDAAKGWTFNVPATDKPRSADEQTVTVPVEYVMDKAKVDLAGTWRTIVRIPKRTIGWMTPEAGTQSVGVADAVSGELIPLNSAIALATDVVGMPLL
jgi:TonB family protein